MPMPRTTRRLDRHLEPLFDASTSQALEHRALAQHPAHTLMARAGSAVAHLAMALAPHARHIWVLCGPGNNGGDGLIAATDLHTTGAARVEVTHWRTPKPLPDDSAWALERARAAGLSFVEEPSAPPDLVIDALLGLGTRDPLGAEATRWCERLARMRCPVLCVDLPSGLDPSTGQMLAPIELPAGKRHTLTFLSAKPGLFTADGRDWSGEVWFDDLGVTSAQDDNPPQAWLYQPGDRVWDLAPGAHRQHKGSHGDVLVIGGQGGEHSGIGMSGAALLAGRAALMAGAGRVFVSPLSESGRLSMAIDPGEPGLMLRTVRQALQPDPPPETVLVCGCGGGSALLRWLPLVVGLPNPLVLDADALNALATDTPTQAALQTRARQGIPTVLTPHPLEAARLLGLSTHQVQADRLEAARALAQRWSAICVLKGSGTVVAEPNGTCTINGSGNARLATAGTGDVLAGLVGAAMARQAPGPDAVRAAVYAHGHLADGWPVHQTLSAGALARRARPVRVPTEG